MRKIAFTLVAVATLSGAAQAVRTGGEDPMLRPIAPDYARRWIEPRLAPQRLHGRSYYVGFNGLAVVLVDTGAGLLLFDGGVPQSVRTLQANIRSLGFDPARIRYIFSTEPHWDHAGGIAALARDSGATVISGTAAAPALRAGQVGSDDPQADIHAPFPPIARVRGVGDGTKIRLGSVTVTAHATAGHTTGSSSWSWRSCEGKSCVNIVFAASINPVSDDEYRFADHPERVAMLRRGAAKLAALRCDIAIPTHPDTNATLEHLATLSRRRAPNPLIEPGACRTLAATYGKRLDARLAKETATPR